MLLNLIRSRYPASPSWPLRIGILAALLVAISQPARADDAYIQRDGQSFALGTSLVEQVITLHEGRLLLIGLKDKTTGRQLLPKGVEIEEFSLRIGQRPEAIGGASGGWKLVDARESRQSQGELRLDITIERERLRITRSYVLYPGSSLIRQAMTIANHADGPIIVSDPAFLSTAAMVDEPGATDFHWMSGAHNAPGQWMLKTEKLRAGSPRLFDSYDAPPHASKGTNGFRPGSASYAPWYALLGSQSKQGLFFGFDYFGHWASQFELRRDGAVAAQLRLAGFRRQLQPGQLITTPWAFAGLFHDDLDNAGNHLLDWQYTYLWDYTRDGRDGTYPWFPALRTLGYWSKGTGWGKPGVGWTGGKPDLESTFRKVFRVADFMRHTGTDVYHRDWGWWDIAGDWNGPDFRATGQYLRKSDMGQLIYAFLYTVSRKSRVAAEHPDWLAGADYDGVTLDLSQPPVASFVSGQLDDFVSRWGDFEWRNDSTITREKTNDTGVLLEQDQSFRRILREFLDKHPNCGFQAVNGGGNFAGYDYVRYASNIQFSDGAVGPLRNYWSSLLFPPDKNCDNPDRWNPAKYDKATWRGLLCFNYDTTGDTWDPARLEGIRQLNDIYHYLLAQGVVGRWVRVYRPVVAGDEASFWFQRLSRDGKRGIIIPKHVPPGAVTIRPKGLLPQARYLVCFQEAVLTESRLGADLMQHGIELPRMLPGELIYLNLPLHPGNKVDNTPPTAPLPLAVVSADNLGYPGVELTWKPATDDSWVSYYQIHRNGAMIDKVSKGSYYFDHSAGADPHANYEMVTVDGAGNLSARAAFKPTAGTAATIVDDAPGAGMTFTGAWSHTAQPPAHAGTISACMDNGATSELVVDGRRMLLFSKLGADCGKLAISIDNRPGEVVDTFSADDIWGVCVWQHQFPTAGKHAVRLTVLGQHTPLSTGDLVHIDGLRVEQE